MADHSTPAGVIQKFATRLCLACDDGTVAPKNIRGREVGGAVIDDDIVVPVCNSCGEMYVRAADAKRIDAAIAKAKQLSPWPAVYCNCAAIAPTMPVYRTAHLPTCPVVPFAALTAEVELARAGLAKIAKSVDIARERDPEKIAGQVAFLREQYNGMCDRLQAAVQERKIGLGGEHVDRLVIEALAEKDAEIARLEAALKMMCEASREVTSLVTSEIDRITREHTGLTAPITVGYYTYGYRELSMHEKLDPKTCIGHTTIGALLNLKRLASQSRPARGNDSAPEDGHA